MPSRSDRLARIERLLAEIQTPLSFEQRAVEVLEASGWPDCPLTARWRAGDRTVAPIIASLGAGLIATVSEAELEL